jgi:hypothetical protein
MNGKLNACKMSPRRRRTSATRQQEGGRRAGRLPFSRLWSKPFFVKSYCIYSVVGTMDLHLLVSILLKQFWRAKAICVGHLKKTFLLIWRRFLNLVYSPKLVRTVCTGTIPYLIRSTHTLNLFVVWRISQNFWRACVVNLVFGTDVFSNQCFWSISVFSLTPMRVQICIQLILVNPDSHSLSRTQSSKNLTEKCVSYSHKIIETLIWIMIHIPEILYWGLELYPEPELYRT